MFLVAVKANQQQQQLAKLANGCSVLMSVTVENDKKTSKTVMTPLMKHLANSM